MKTQVEFRSESFPPYEGEEDEINPGLWGKRLAEYLQQKLRDAVKSIPKIGGGLSPSKTMPFLSGSVAVIRMVTRTNSWSSSNPRLRPFESGSRESTPLRYSTISLPPSIASSPQTRKSTTFVGTTEGRQFTAQTL